METEKWKNWGGGEKCRAGLRLELNQGYTQREECSRGKEVVTEVYKRVERKAILRLQDDQGSGIASRVLHQEERGGGIGLDHVRGERERKWSFRKDALIIR